MGPTQKRVGAARTDYGMYVTNKGLSLDVEAQYRSNPGERAKIRPKGALRTVSTGELDDAAVVVRLAEGHARSKLR